MKVTRTIDEIRRVVAQGRRAGAKQVALVATMGGLHPGHYGLIDAGLMACEVARLLGVESRVRLLEKHIHLFIASFLLALHLRSSDQGMNAVVERDRPNRSVLEFRWIPVPEPEGLP